MTINASEIIMLLTVGGLTAVFFLWKSAQSNSKPNTISSPAVKITPNSTPKSLASTPSKSNKKSIIERISDPEKPVNVVFFYGSQTGTAEDLATRLSKELISTFNLNTVVCDLEEYNMKELLEVPSNVLVVFMMATYGEGEPTDNAVEFYEWLIKGDIDATLDEASGSTAAKNLNYVSFGLGNRTYEHYNAIARRLDKKLRSLGATRIGAAGEGDDDGSLEDDFLNWKVGAVKDIAAFFDLDASASAENSKKTRNDPHKPSFELIEHQSMEAFQEKVYWGEISIDGPRRWDTPVEDVTGAQSNKSGYQRFIENRSNDIAHDSKHPYYASVAESRTLYQNSVDEFSFPGVDISLSNNIPSRYSIDGAKVKIIRQCLHLEIDIEGSGLKYETGDHVGVYALNSDEEVIGLARALGIEAKLDTVVELKSKNDTKLPFPTPSTIRTVLTYYVDLHNELKQHHLEILGKYVTNDNEKARLFEYVDNREKYVAEIEKQRINLKDILHKFPSIKVPLAVVLTDILTKSIVRYYSISSSSLKSPNTVAITAVVVRYAISQETPTKHVAIKEGLATSWLQRLHESREKGVSSDITSIYTPKLAVPMYIRASAFRLPKPEIPVVMVGPGTGVSPFRGFVTERFCQAESGLKVGPTWLFFGCRNPKIDFMYREEFESIDQTIEKWKAEGSSKAYEFRLVTAFSRTAEPKLYVQHRLKEHKHRIWALLSAEGGYFYVCGDAKSMAKDVNTEIHQMARDCGGMSEEEAKEWVKGLKSAGRYLEDVWA